MPKPVVGRLGVSFPAVDGKKTQQQATILLPAHVAHAFFFFCLLLLLIELLSILLACPRGPAADGWMAANQANPRGEEEASLSI